MIKNVLLPEKLGLYHIFPKRIAGIIIGATRIDETII